MGVVYGDIGTSPLYAMRECFHGEHAVAVTTANILGVLSLIFWSLILMISLKYVVYVLRADNHGEGGILALMALALSRRGPGRATSAFAMIGLFGAALLYGDGMLTPAISVLSAVEGLRIAAPSLTNAVVPLTVLILIGLFALQRRGTAGIGRVFGPIILLWFFVLAVLGVTEIASRPEVLAAVDPRHAARFLASTHGRGLIVLAAVFLVITGGEALYADLGHFGARPIRVTWFAVALPALLANYLGQGALLLRNPTAAASPFYHLAPAWALYPLIALATMATIIASQALISGAFSLTRQATMLGVLPRARIQHTSAVQIGQIYVPTANWLLMLSTVALVMSFASSTNLAAAYGVAVSLTMVITTVLAYGVARDVWGWRPPAAAALTAIFLCIDLAFLLVNLTKVTHGGWFPLFLGGLVFALMTTWKKGRALLASRIREATLPIEDFFELMRVERPAIVPGTAVFMIGSAEGAPWTLLRNFEHNRVVHTHNILLTIVTKDVPRVPEEQRLTVTPLLEGFVRIVATYGFMETPDVPALLARSGIDGYLPEYTTFFLGREVLLAGDDTGMSAWRKRLFAFLAQGSERATAFFRIPPEKVIEIGWQIRL